MTAGRQAIPLLLLGILLFAQVSPSQAFCAYNEGDKAVTFYIVPPSSSSFKKVVQPGDSECCNWKNGSCFADPEYSTDGVGTGGGIAEGADPPKEHPDQCDPVAMIISQVSPVCNTRLLRAHPFTFCECCILSYAGSCGRPRHQATAC